MASAVSCLSASGCSPSFAVSLKMTFFQTAQNHHRRVHTESQHLSPAYFTAGVDVSLGRRGNVLPSNFDARSEPSQPPSSSTFDYEPVETYEDTGKVLVGTRVRTRCCAVAPWCPRLRDRLPAILRVRARRKFKLAKVEGHGVAFDDALCLRQLEGLGRGFIGERQRIGRASTPSCHRRRHR